MSGHRAPIDRTAAAHAGTLTDVVRMVERLPLSDSEKTEAVRRPLPGSEEAGD